MIYHKGQFETFLTGEAEKQGVTESKLKERGTFAAKQIMNRINQKALLLSQGAMIAAGYAGATWLSAAFGIAYGAVQFRLSEALTVLCAFTPAAVPGLAVGCLLGNLASPYGVWDIVPGAVSTLLAALVGRKLRRVTVKGIPVLTLLMPVLFNALFVGAETAVLSGGEAGLPAFFVAAAQVAAGEAAVCFLGGIPLFFAVRKSRVFRNES